MRVEVLFWVGAAFFSLLPLWSAAYGWWQARQHHDEPIGTVFRDGALFFFSATMTATSFGLYMRVPELRDADPLLAFIAWFFGVGLIIKSVESYKPVAMARFIHSEHEPTKARGFVFDAMATAGAAFFYGLTLYVAFLGRHAS